MYHYQLNQASVKRIYPRIKIMFKKHITLGNIIISVFSAIMLFLLLMITLATIYDVKQDREQQTLNLIRKNAVRLYKIQEAEEYCAKINQYTENHCKVRYDLI